MLNYLFGKHTKTIFLMVGVVVLLISLCLQTCQNKKYASALSEQILKNQKLDSVINKQGQIISTQEVIITSNKEDLRNLTDSIFDLSSKHDKKIREVKAYFSSRTVTSIKEVLIPFTDSLQMRRFSDSVERVCADVISFYRDSSIQVPLRDSISTPNFSLDYNIDQSGLTIKSLEIPDSLHLRVVELKGGLFKKRSLELQMLHTNPLVKTTGSNSIIYQPKKKLRWGEKALLIGAGIIIGSKLAN